MADQIPYDIKVRRERFVPTGPDLDDLDAAGIVAADDTVVVSAVYAAEEEGSHPGERVPALTVAVYVWQGEAVTRWSSSELTFADKRANLAMRQVLARAQRVADLANDLANGVPIPLEGPIDRVVDEVAANLQRSWSLLHCSEATAPPLSNLFARSLARHMMGRLRIIRDRDGSEPLP
jgi:hypothetical protein